MYCGTERSYNVAECHRCGGSWPDQLVEQLDASLLGEEEPAGHARLLDDPGSGPPPRWWIPAAAAVIVLGGIGLIASWIVGDEAAAPATTIAATAPPPQPSPPTSSLATTGPPPTAETSETTIQTTTTSTTTTTTTLPPLEPIGEPIPAADLSLGAFALGPLRFGDSGAEVIGRLVASLGQPTNIHDADPTWGLCEGDAGRVVRFASLAVVVIGEEDEEVFAAYRLDAGSEDSALADLSTISGVKIGATFAELDAAYEASITALIDVDGVPSFVVLRSSDRRTLLWGPVDGEGAAAMVSGIYSPRPCDRGPQA